MSRNDDFQRLFDQLDTLSVGFSPIFRNFNVPANNYPHHNIIKISDTEILLELAVAGFTKDEITMEEHQGLLTIRGSREPATAQPEYQYRGIAARSFSKSFQLAEYFEVESAMLLNGILTIRFIKNVPETAKPKLIAIK
jgi:molecular chaperone IbpA